MAFTNHVCWHRDLLSRVISNDAAQTAQAEEHFFRATHEPVRMRCVGRNGGPASGEVITEDDLRAVFLDRRRRHMHVLIQGTAGSGKSHLVHWLYVTIPKTPDRRIVLLPKVGTNLKGMIERILDGMEGEVFEDYRKRLRYATENLSVERARENLVNHIAVAVGENGPYANEEVADDDEAALRPILIAQLPPLLYDSTFRRALFQPNSIIDQLVQHVLGQSDRELLTEPRHLKASDIPAGLHPNRLTEDARDLYCQIEEFDELRDAALRWINRNVDWALRRMVDLSDDDLGNLLREVRISLANAGKELLILVEDFAKQQGFDAALAEALLIEPEQGGDRLCVLRSAVAVTSNYFEKAVDTVRHRAQLVVDLDLDCRSEAGRVVSRDDLARFASRYLNAARLPDGALQQWHAQSSGSPDSAADPPPSACSECEHREICFTAFGAAEGFGLYPFTMQALDQMLTRYMQREGNWSGAFIPRHLLNQVLLPTLDRDSRALEAGQFPPPSLLSRYGRRSMPAIHAKALADQYREQADHYQAVYELWGNVNPPGGVCAGVFEAFGLQPPDAGKVTVRVCIASGLRAGSSCPATEEGSFSEDAAPAGVCAACIGPRAVRICSVSGMRATAACPEVSEVLVEPGKAMPAICTQHATQRLNICEDTGLQANGACPRTTVCELPVGQPAPATCTMHSPIPTDVQRRRDELNAWSNGKKLSYETAQWLREELFDAVATYIDWDRAGLARGAFCGQGRAFQATSIYLQRQPTQQPNRQVQLVVPADGDFHQATIAFEGLLLYQHYGDWGFDQDGGRRRAYLELIHALSEDVLRQLQRTTTEMETWDPVPPLVELLTLAARVYGKLPPTNASLEDRVNALFLPWAKIQPPTEPRCSPWRELARTFTTVRSGNRTIGELLQDLLLSRVSCHKGGGGDPQVIDAAALMAAIEKTRSGAGTQYPVPDWVRPDYQEIRRAQQRVEQYLDAALDCERQRCLEWLQWVRAAAGDQPRKAELAAAAKRAFEAAEGEGVLRGTTREQFFGPEGTTGVLGAFRRCAFDTALDVLSTLEKLDPAEERGRALAILGASDLATPMVAADEFLKTAAAFLTVTEARVQVAVDDLIGDTDVRTVQAEIEKSLSGLAAMLAELTEGAADAD